MKSYAIYDKDGTIKKVIVTTRKDAVESNLAKDMKYIEVGPEVKRSSYQIISGKAEKVKIKVDQKIPYNPSVVGKSDYPTTDKMIDDIRNIDDLKPILKMMLGQIGRRK